MSPANSIPDQVSSKAKRVLVNRERLPAFQGQQDRDAVLESDCDEALLMVIDEMGWTQELKTLIELNSY